MSVVGAIRRIWPILPPAALIVALWLVGTGLGPSAQLDVTTGLIYVCMVIALYTFVGLSGVFSFGHVAFVGMGAYVAGLLAIPVATKELLYTDLPGVLADVELSSFAAILAGGAAAAILALLLAPALGRLVGLSASLATFALLVIVNEVARNWEEVTRGTKGLLSVPQNTTLTNAMLWALAFLVLAHLFRSSRIGLQLQAAREDPVAAAALGVNVGRLRGIALVVSAFLAGAAGGVYGQLLGSFNPNVFFLDLTFLTIAMLVVGGVNSLTGAVVGAVTITVLNQILRELESAVDRPGVTEVGFAFLAIAILILRPQGVTGGREVPLPRFLRPRRGAGGSPAGELEGASAPDVGATTR